MKKKPIYIALLGSFMISIISFIITKNPKVFLSNMTLIFISYMGANLVINRIYNLLLISKKLNSNPKK